MKKQLKIHEREQFVDYVYSFYSADGLYPIEGTTKDLIYHLTIFLESQIIVEYDTIDRERIRELILGFFICTI